MSVSKNFWTVYTEDLDAAAEHEGTHVLGLFTHGPGALLSKDRHFEAASDFAGFKVRTPGGYPADLLKGMGATTLFMSSGEVYEKLTRGVIDGVCMPLDSLLAFKLEKHLTDVMTVSGGLYKHLMVPCDEPGQMGRHFPRRSGGNHVCFRFGLL